MTPAACEFSAASAIERSMRALPVLPPRRHNARCVPERFVGGHEPTIDELLGDPILERLLASDGLRMGELLVLIAEMRQALKRR